MYAKRSRKSYRKSNNPPTVIWWLRRDLRLHDNPTLHQALAHGAVVPLFILDRQLRAALRTRRHPFLVNSLKALDAELRRRGSRLIVRSGEVQAVLSKLLTELPAQAIYAEEDYTPYARQRDEQLAQCLPLHLVQGELVHHPLSLLKPDGTAYTVFTSFSKTWKARLPHKLEVLPALEQLPAVRSDLPSESLPTFPEDKLFPAGEAEARHRLEQFTRGVDSQGVIPIYTYHQQRNRLDIHGTSQLSPYIHLGILSMRETVRCAQQAIEEATSFQECQSAEAWLNELIWREFYVHILYHYPEVSRQSFRPEYAQIRWENDVDAFCAWRNGETGYPLVDAAMRQLSESGWMHNRARMVVASFLVKDLLIDWRWGEAWFMEQLIDADLAANNGGWQWCAGVGTDAAPYFRIFNPIVQSQKFDPQGVYIRRWLPELAHLPSPHIHTPWTAGVSISGYPPPIIDHARARERALRAYDQAKAAGAFTPPDQAKQAQ